MTRTTNSMGKILWGMIRGDGFPKPNAKSKLTIRGGEWSSKDRFNKGEKIRHVVTRMDKNGNPLQEVEEWWVIDELVLKPHSWLTKAKGWDDDWYIVDKCVMRRTLLDVDEFDD